LRKATQAIHYFVGKCGEEGIDKLKALKLIFFTDRYLMRMHAMSLTGDTYYAMKNGPVASRTYDVISLDPKWLKDTEFNYVTQFLNPPQEDHKVKAKKASEYQVFSRLETDIMDQVWAKYGHLTTEQIVEETHKYPEWSIYEKRLESEKRTNIDLEDFFLESKVIDDLAIISEDDAEECITILKADADKEKQLSNLFGTIL